MCVHVLGEGGVSEAGSSNRLCSAFRALIETYCQSDKHICMWCAFQEVLFCSLLLISSPSLAYRNVHVHVHTHTHTVYTAGGAVGMVVAIMRTKRES